MPWGVAVAAVVGAVATSQAADKGADASNRATAATVGEQRRQFDLTRQDMAPWLREGGWALGEQRRFLEGDMSGFINSAEYKAAMDQGFKGLERGLAAGGALGSGGADADRIALGQQLATQYAGNYWARLAGLSQTGNSTAGQLGQFGSQAAANIGNAYMQNGQARASAYAAQGNAWANAANQWGQAYMYNRGGR